MDTLDRAPSRAERYRQILAVLVKHGIAAAGTGEATARADELRSACEELGPTFIKLGQMLATRGDILPPEYRSELEKLQDSVEPLDADYIVREIEGELGEPVGELFVAFDRTPLGSASIGQVHAARLPDGRDVVVKVRKPNVRELIERDLDILLQLASSSQKLFPYLQDYDLRGTIEEFGDTLRAELDYRREARNVETFNELLEGEDGIELPETILQYSTSNVLTLTRVGGVRTSMQLPESRIDREAAAQRLAMFELEPALVNGIFHADPHGGNVLVQEDGRISIVDFGMVGRLNDDLRRRVADLVMGFTHGDGDRVTDRLIAIAPSTRPIDRGALVQQVNRLVERATRETIGGIRVGQALNDLIELVRAHRLRLPASVAMLFRALIMCEAAILELAPQRGLTDFLDPIAKRILAARLSPREWSSRASTSAMDAAELAVELPRRADRVLSEVERGNLRVWARLEDFDPLVKRLERMVERANASMIAAACIVAITVLFVVYRPSGWHTFASIFLWVAAIIAILWVIRTVWATMRRL